MEINGPGIYIHYTCRPFKHKRGAPEISYASNNENMNQRILRQNSENTLLAASCPIRSDIVARGYLNEIFGLYRDCDSIKKVLIAKEVTKIELSSFERCSNLEIVEFEEPSSLTFIGLKAFRQCKKLISIEIPDSVINIAEYVFENCETLNYIKFPKNVEVLKRGICKNLGNLEKVILPDKLKKIEAEVFYKTKIKTIQLPPTLEYIGCHSFLECEYLTEIILPDTIKVIKNNTFEGCRNLTSINLPLELTTIEKKAFFNCKSLETIIFPDKKINFVIQLNAFSGCAKLQNVYINSNASINASPPNQGTIDLFLNKDCKVNYFSVEGIKRKKLKSKLERRIHKLKKHKKINHM